MRIKPRSRVRGRHAGPNQSRLTTGERYKNVSIQFLSAEDGPFLVQAEVLRRDDEMVISIPPQSSSDPYFVRGQKQGYFFAGRDSLAHELEANVIARWALLGDVYVGIWIENGIEYLFSFSVRHSPPKPTWTRPA